MKKKLLTDLKPNDSIFYIAGRSVSDGDDHAIEFKVKEVRNENGCFSVRNCEWNEDNCQLFNMPLNEIDELDSFVDKYGYYGTTREAVINLYNECIDTDIAYLKTRLQQYTDETNMEIEELESKKLPLN